MKILRNLSSKSVILCLSVIGLATTLSATPRVAILGDSLSTGGATHPQLAFDPERLYKVFEDQTLVTPRLIDIPDASRFKLSEDLLPPNRLWPASREYSGGFEWVVRHLVLSLGKRYLDTEQYSWGYLTANALGFAPAEILLAADDGARTQQISRHYDRVLDATSGTRPEKMFLFYTGNDLCAPSVDFVPTVDDYGAQLERGLRYIARNGLAPDGGTDVYVLGFLGILQLLYSPEILEKPIFAFGEMITCKDLRAQGFRPKVVDGKVYRPDLPLEAAYFGELMPPNPAAFCPTLFGPVGVGGQDREQVIGTLANRIRDFRDQQKAMVERLNKEMRDPAIRFHYIDATAALTFKGEDIAGDCFHLSIAGHSKVATAVIESALGQK